VVRVSVKGFKATALPLPLPQSGTDSAAFQVAWWLRHGYFSISDTQQFARHTVVSEPRFLFLGVPILTEDMGLHTIALSQTEVRPESQALVG
jgi:hypothetical protein